jgi:lysophospholipase L1-like esterase
MIIGIGDSITYGQHLGPDEAWPQLIQGYEVLSAGVPSDTTRLGLERFPRDVQALRPEVVVIQFGHNDCNRWDSDRGLPRVSERAYAANLDEMVARCRVFDATPLLCTLTPSHRSARHAADVATYDGILRRVARANEVEIIDVRTVFMPDGVEDDMPLLLDDGLHLSQMGHRFYATTVQRALDAHYGR